MKSFVTLARNFVSLAKGVKSLAVLLLGLSVLSSVLFSGIDTANNYSAAIARGRALGSLGKVSPTLSNAISAKSLPQVRIQNEVKLAGVNPTALQAK